MPRVDRAAKYVRQAEFLQKTRDDPTAPRKMRVMAAMAYGKMMERLDEYAERGAQRREQRRREKLDGSLAELDFRRSQDLSPEDEQDRLEEERDERIQNQFASVLGKPQGTGDANV